MDHPSDFDDARPSQLPCVGGLLAGTLALMTTWAAPEPDARIGAEQQRSLIARKLVSNLGLLRNHPEIGPALQQVIGRVHERWSRLPQDCVTAPQSPSDLASAAPAALH